MITETKKGYKKTKLGWIPEEWELKRFTDFSELIHGFQFRKEHFVAKGIPVIKIGSLIDSKGIDFADASYIDPSTLNQFEKFKLFKGDVLMALTGGTLGKVSVVQEDFGDILQNYRVGKFVPKENSYGEYLVQLLQSFFVQQRVKNLVNEAAQPNFGKQDFDKIWIPLPPLPEQQKIATILSTWDKAIDKLTQLIAAKEQQKKGLMQQLLTGKKRFAGFKDEWKEVKLGDCSILSGDYGINAAGVEYNEVLPKYLRITDIDDSGLLKTESMVSVDSPDSQKYLLENEDIVFARTGASVGKHYVHNQNRYGSLVFAGFLIRFRLNKNVLLPNFLKAFLSTTEYWNWVSVMSQRSGQPGINGKEYGILKVPVPTIHEQQKIASVLSAADKEIELLKNELEHLQQQKKGLMQVLLTGEVRVKIL